MSENNIKPPTQLTSAEGTFTSNASGPFAWLRRLYDWVLHWADTPYGLRALVLLSLIESIFFPIPPDVLLIALTLGARPKWFKFALSCTIASVVGGMIGYAIGYGMWSALADTFYQWIPGFTEAKFQKISGLYETWDFWVVFTAGFTPIPFKVITVTAGVCKINFFIFIFAALLSRGARFFIVAKLLNVYGEPIREWIERRFNMLSIAFTVLLIGGFLLIKVIL
jgi:membrane protein YqaA with SNARE-associated domain